MAQQEPVKINPDAMKQLVKMLVHARIRAQRGQQEQKKAQ